MFIGASSTHTGTIINTINAKSQLIEVTIQSEVFVNNIVVQHF